MVKEIPVDYSISIAPSQQQWFGRYYCPKAKEDFISAVTQQSSRRIRQRLLGTGKGELTIIICHRGITARLWSRSSR